FEVADGHLPGSGDEPPMTACGGNLIGGEIIRNEQCPLCGLATFEDAVLGAEQAPKDLRFLFEKSMRIVLYENSLN
ncbi:MAG: hypothetical protein K5919_05470, partial [Clostridiales bacterium]|nr:hypothetical protein [Clostridiales bacterium]